MRVTARQNDWTWVPRMELGQSEFVREHHTRLRWAAQHYNKKLEGFARFVSRKEGCGARIWRVE